MVFAEIQYTPPYADMHEPLVGLLGRHFEHIESGLQSDSYIWVRAREQRIEVDTFTSMRHEVKARGPSELLDRVLEVLSLEYRLWIFDPPVREGHEPEADG